MLKILLYYASYVYDNIPTLFFTITLLVCYLLHVQKWLLIYFCKLFTTCIKKVSIVTESLLLSWFSQIYIMLEVRLDKYINFHFSIRFCSLVCTYRVKKAKPKVMYEFSHSNTFSLPFPCGPVSISTWWLPRDLEHRK